MTQNQITKQLHLLIKEYFKLNKVNFVPGKTRIQYAGAAYDHKEIIAVTDSLLSGWLGLGKQGGKFEKELAQYVGTEHAVLVNSGSSANLLAVTSLTTPSSPNRLNEGDEVIVAACSFPTTINPILQNRLVPVFLDVNPETYNINAEDLPKAISKKTKAIFLCHNLGNPNEMDKIMHFAKTYKLAVIEDNCDAMGAKYAGQKTGSFGIIGTESFYPAHHMTMGEGGALFTNDPNLLRTIRSLRDWGRACWCGASGGGRHGKCGMRFKFKIDNHNYDHKYIFSNIGYNLKPTESQAAMGRIQLKKLPTFLKKRDHNFKVLFQYFQKHDKYFILPRALPKAEPSWFSFLLTINDTAPFDRHTLVSFLEEYNIETRPSFSGNILRQPAYQNIKHRVASDLNNSNRIFEKTFFIGINPKLTEAQIAYIIRVFDIFLSRY